MPRNPARPLIQGLTTLKPQLMQTLSFYCFQSLCWLQVQSAGVRLVTFRHEHKTWNEWKSTSSSQGKCHCARLASTQSVTSRSREFFILFDGIGTNIGTEKVSDLVPKKIGTEKSLGTGHRHIWSRSRNFPGSRLSHWTFSNLLYPFLIFISQFLVRIFVSFWVSVSVSSRPVGTGKRPGTIWEKIWYRKKSRSDFWSRYTLHQPNSQPTFVIFFWDIFSVPSVWRGRNQ